MGRQHPRDASTDRPPAPLAGYLHPAAPSAHAPWRVPSEGRTARASDPRPAAPAKRQAFASPGPPPPSVEAAIASGSLARLASDLRARLEKLARSDYSGHALLQAKKQVRASREGAAVAGLSFALPRRHTWTP